MNIKYCTTCGTTEIMERIPSYCPKCTKENQEHSVEIMEELKFYINDLGRVFTVKDKVVIEVPLIVNKDKVVIEVPLIVNQTYGYRQPI